VKRPQLTPANRFLWAWLAVLWRDWRSALVLVKPETVIAWHRKGFRLLWSGKVRRGPSGRPAVPLEVRKLVHKMSHEKPLWGAQRIHGELLKLGHPHPLHQPILCRSEISLHPPLWPVPKAPLSK
jgi:hypothetical protein